MNTSELTMQFIGKHFSFVHKATFALVNQKTCQPLPNKSVLLHES